ncbi:hypothetical protein [Streptomyces sp. SM1]|uniref:hypothetical protein n=1 Tax=Streptomyces sp. SM1 TaxID=402229 RepID=UPI001CA480FC|nr:hypothetical protein [Streptomyces sp. SM1]
MRTWRSRTSPAAGDLIRRAAVELVLQGRRAVKGLRDLAQLLTDLEHAHRLRRTPPILERPLHQTDSRALLARRSAHEICAVPRYRARRRGPSHTRWWPEGRHTGI